MFTVIVIMFTW